MRTEVQGCCDTLEVRCLQNTLLVGEACADTVRQIVRTVAVEGCRTGNGYVVVVRESGTINLVLPVGVGIAKELSCRAVSTHLRGNHVAELVAIEYVNSLLLHADSEAACIRNAWLLSLVAFLSGDNDYTVTTTATIDGCCRCVLQNGERLDILRVYH